MAAVRFASCVRRVRARGPAYHTVPTLPQVNSYAELKSQYRPEVPATFNIGLSVCDKHVANGLGAREALIIGTPGKGTSDKRYTFSQLKELSDRLANGLRAIGVSQGDRVGILLPQCAETAMTHISVYKSGAIALPLFTLFGPEAVEYRLSNSRAACVVTDMTGLETVLAVKHSLPELRSIVVVREHDAVDAGGSTSGLPSLPDGVHCFYSLLHKGSHSFAPVTTAAEDPALIIYTSGTTGTPKGCVHAHRVLLGHMPGVEMPHNFFPQPDDMFWTPADWAWIGGLLDVLLPSWYHAVPVLAYRAKKFDPEEAFDLMDKYRIKNMFMPPTALKLIRRACTRKHQLRSLGIGGETLGEELLAWGRDTFGVTINEFYGQTECNLILSNCSVLEDFPGSMGKPVPGKEVAIVDEQGHPVPVGDVGDVAVKRPDLTMFLRYWDMPEATANKFRGDWLVTGDQARIDESGYFWYVGRDDDIITSSGYRIGPGEIEDCLLRHPKVALAAVVGKPDPLRTEVVKAFLVLRGEYASLTDRPDCDEARALVADIQEFVKAKLAAYEYPREVEFVHELPMTTTGKVIRKALRELEKQRAKAAM